MIDLLLELVLANPVWATGTVVLLVVVAYENDVAPVSVAKPVGVLGGSFIAGRVVGPQLVQATTEWVFAAVPLGVGLA